MHPMNVLLIGSGGREHALAWAILASPLLGKLYCAPGNAGIAEIAECAALDAADHAAVVRFCREKRIDLVVVGPEAPLVAGLADDLARFLRGKWKSMRVIEHEAEDRGQRSEVRDRKSGKPADGGPWDGAAVANHNHSEQPEKARDPCPG